MAILSCRSIIVRRHESTIYRSLCYLVSFYNVNYTVMSVRAQCNVCTRIKLKNVTLFLPVNSCPLRCDVERVRSTVGISVKYFLFEYVHNNTRQSNNPREEGGPIWRFVRHVNYAKQKTVDHPYSGNQVEEIFRNLPKSFTTPDVELDRSKMEDKN